MSYAALLTQTVTVIRASLASSTSDAEGNPVQATPTEASYSGLVQHRDPSLSDRATETRIGPDSILSDALLFLPSTAVIDAKDRVRYAGAIYEVIGNPVTLNTPRGAHHIEAALRRITI